MKGRSVKTSQVTKVTFMPGSSSGGRYRPEARSETAQADHRERAVEGTEDGVRARGEEEVLDREAGRAHEIDDACGGPHGDVVFLLQPRHDGLDPLGPVVAVGRVDREAPSRGRASSRAGVARRHRTRRGRAHRPRREDERPKRRVVIAEGSRASSLLEEGHREPARRPSARANGTPGRRKRPIPEAGRRAGAEEERRVPARGVDSRRRVAEEGRRCAGVPSRAVRTCAGPR